MSDPIEDAFKSLHQGNLLAAKDARIKQLEERLEAMREAGDELWYCVRHAKRIDADQLLEAIEDWQEARNHG
jgi:predicted peroxiredoxin